MNQAASCLGSISIFVRVLKTRLKKILSQDLERVENVF
jgi:hypothetical protein